MQWQQWQGYVEVSMEDGTSLGSAALRLERWQRWVGVLRSPANSAAKPWPAGQTVLLQLPDGRSFHARLEPAVCEEGPVLFQMAHVAAQPSDFEAIVAGTQA